MFGVFNSPQSQAHGVVARSRPLALASALGLAIAACPLEALAAPSGAPSETMAPLAQSSAAPAAKAPLAHAPAAPLVETSPEPLEDAPTPREDSYRGLLTASYILAPFAALAVGGGLSELEVSDELAVFGAGSMFLAPSIIHGAHGNELAPLSFFGLVGSTVGGMFIGGVAGYYFGGLGCDPEEDSDSCDFAALGGVVYGALLGSVAGYTSFAIFDVAMNGAVPMEDPRADRATLQLWVNPLPAVRTERAESTSPFSGVQLGATLTM